MSSERNARDVNSARGESAAWRDQPMSALTDTHCRRQALVNCPNVRLPCVAPDWLAGAILGLPD